MELSPIKHMRSLLAEGYLSSDVLRTLTTLTLAEADSSINREYRWYFLLCNLTFFRVLSLKGGHSGDVESALQHLAAAAVQGLEAIEKNQTESVVHAANQMTEAFITIDSYHHS
jgi:hypothetical protein